MHVKTASLLNLNGVFEMKVSNSCWSCLIETAADHLHFRNPEDTEQDDSFIRLEMELFNGDLIRDETSHLCIPFSIMSPLSGNP